MNRAEAGRLLAMRGELRAREDDRARVRVARTQVVKKFVPKIRHGLDIEHEQVWFRVEHEPLRLIESRRDIDLGRRRRLLKGGTDLLGHFHVRLENNNALAAGGR